MWVDEKEVSNSGGNLCLHILGNLKTYIGIGLAKQAYTRQCELEFSLKDIPKAELIKQIVATGKIVDDGLSTLHENQLNEEFPIVIWEKPTEMGFTLLTLPLI